MEKKKQTNKQKTTQNKTKKKMKKKKNNKIKYPRSAQEIYRDTFALNQQISFPFPLPLFSFDLRMTPHKYLVTAS